MSTRIGRLRLRRRLTLAVAAATALVLVGAAAGAAGDLDTSFGSGGKVVTDFGGGDFASYDAANAVAIQQDGKIVAAGSSTSGYGDFALARYNADGSLDASFGSGGKVLTDFGTVDDPRYAWAYAVAIQRDGKIVAAGGSYYNGNLDFALARYNADGSLDASFGSGGKVLTDFIDEEAFAVAIQNDGKIVVAGYSGFFGISGNLDFALARYNADGSLDASFGSGGKVVTDFGGGDFANRDVARAVAIQKDGKIVAAGDSVAGGSGDFALARYNTNGSLDRNFGSGGKVLTDMTDISGSNSGDGARAVVIQGNGKIVAAGGSSNYASGNADFALARYNTNGSLDRSFGSRGKVLTDFSGRSEGASAAAIQGNGKIVAAGFSNPSPEHESALDDFALARYNANGSLDTSFGFGGKVVTDFTGGQDLANAVAIQGNGKIVAAGYSDSSLGDFALVRYLP